MKRSQFVLLILCRPTPHSASLWKSSPSRGKVEHAIWNWHRFNWTWTIFQSSEMRKHSTSPTWRVRCKNCWRLTLWMYPHVFILLINAVECAIGRYLFVAHQSSPQERRKECCGRVVQRDDAAGAEREIARLFVAQRELWLRRFGRVRVWRIGKESPVVVCSNRCRNALTVYLVYCYWVIGWSKMVG